MEEVGALRKTFGSRNNCATPQDKIHFKKFFFFCRRIGAPLDAKPERTTLGQRFCHRATEPQRRREGRTAALSLHLSFSPSLCHCGSVANFSACDTPNIPNGRARVGTTSAWKS